MRTGSFERGDQPRSVPDPDGDEYDQMVERTRALADRRFGDAEPDKAPLDVGHPNLGESFIPVWGSGREALADFHDGDLIGGAINTILTGTDLAGAGVIARDLFAGGLKTAGSHTWGATRRWLGQRQYLAPYQHGHHALIPRGGWGKSVPDLVKNQPFNIKPMPSPAVHARIHGPYQGQPQYNAVERFWRGTPRWWKAAIGEVASSPAAGAEAESHRK